ncbi:MAG: metallophosphoesterase family protein [Nitrososphaerales archaeon]
MKIGVLSDTHQDLFEDISPSVLDELSGVDIIVHAGDFVSRPLLQGLQKRGNFKGVHGNMDSVEIKNELPVTTHFEVNSFRIGVAHPAEGGDPSLIEQKVGSKFSNVDVIIHGHSHMPKNEMVNGVLHFNPGSASGAFPAMIQTIGILRLDDRIKGEIIKL